MNLTALPARNITNRPSERTPKKETELCKKSAISAAAASGSDEPAIYSPISGQNEQSIYRITEINAAAIHSAESAVSRYT